jgi:tRNA threonylcarbamoyladenosine dehydratase
MTARMIYEINPHAELHMFSEGLNNDNLDNFLNGDPKPRVIFEAIDDFEMKIRVRLAAKQAKVPVVMLTNLGDNILVDVERYDTDHNTKIFNGLIGDLAEDILNTKITEEDKKRYAVGLVGKDNVPERALRSLPELGKTLVGRPQIMSTVTAASGLAPLIFRKIILGDELPSGRKLIKLNEVV